MTNENMNLWRKQWLLSINELTSLDLQRKSWLDKNQNNPHWSFVEFMCSYFDDLDIHDSYKNPIKKKWMTFEEFEIIKEWHIALDIYEAPNNNDFDHESILNDPNWIRILKIGQKTKIELTLVLNDIEGNFLNHEIEFGEPK